METRSARGAKDAGRLRDLKFATLEEAVVDARQLLESGYVRHGNWTLGQICWHLRTVQDPSIDGYPWFFSLFAFLRPIVRRTLMPKILRGDSPRGIRTASIFIPANELNDNEEVAAFAESVERFLQHQGTFHPHPGFGHLDLETLHRVHAAHAAHHLRFLRSAGEL
ncbi:hypothetical protein Pan97_10930 [Bremerella volcania]|uniref:DUF1569 domain-containing protein n=1 Tax=Bremerella volcania TaxID=2527984 RepID=A0A518C4D2_9BACT|nr:DUF1569 domain-containing protein [Bremerella volcania]QDU74089.1 hypothetical protein Pan97_10930 [Bremerella volcania]